MELALLYLTLSTAATVKIQPNRLQFFHYEQFTLSCQLSESGWTVKRNTSAKMSQPCLSKSGFGDSRVPSCILKNVYTSDSGLYWCESEGGKERSNILSITVTAAPVILESPAVPVKEGDNVTLRCSYKGRYDPKSTSNFEAAFFKDGVFIGTEHEEKLILSVQKSDEGFYKCKHPTKGESAQSLLAVRDSVKTTPKTHPTTTPPHRPLPPPVTPISFTLLLCLILAFILYTIIIIVCVYAYQKYTKARAKAESVIYDHLIIHE